MVSLLFTLDSNSLPCSVRFVCGVRLKVCSSKLYRCMHMDKHCIYQIWNVPIVQCNMCSSNYAKSWKCIKNKNNMNRIYFQFCLSAHNLNKFSIICEDMHARSYAILKVCNAFFFNIYQYTSCSPPTLCTHTYKHTQIYYGKMDYPLSRLRRIFACAAIFVDNFVQCFFFVCFYNVCMFVCLLPVWLVIIFIIVIIFAMMILVLCFRDSTKNNHLPTTFPCYQTEHLTCIYAIFFFSFLRCSLMFSVEYVFIMRCNWCGKSFMCWYLTRVGQSVMWWQFEWEYHINLAVSTEHL